MRIELTKTTANTFRQTREAQAQSQSELATKLGWPRSKIKRIERGETKTIEEKDLTALSRALKLPTNATASSKTKTDRAPEGVFTKTTWIAQRKTGANRVFFKVEMAKEMAVRALLGQKVQMGKSVGVVHGVESDEDRLKKGEKLTVMLWGKNLYRQVQRTQ